MDSFELANRVRAKLAGTAMSDEQILLALAVTVTGAPAKITWTWGGPTLTARLFAGKSRWALEARGHSEETMKGLIVQGMTVALVHDHTGCRCTEQCQAFIVFDRAVRGPMAA